GGGAPPPAHARPLQVRPLAHATRAARPPDRQVPLRLLDPPDPALRSLRPGLRRGGSRPHGLPRVRAHLPRRAPREPPARAARHPDGGGRRAVRLARAPRRDAGAHVPRVPGEADLPGARGRALKGGAVALALAAMVAPAWALSGPEIYVQACAPCHGADGRGAPAGSGITVPLPDFTDCAVSTAETTANWAGLVRRGGRFLGMSDEMPAFGDALTEEEIRAVLAYLRSFCAEPRYPIGDLNYRRPVFVEKAFPEDEAVLGGEIESARRERGYTAEMELEKRIGPRGQIAVSLPAGVVDGHGAPLLAPTLYLPLSRRGHVALGAGVEIPVAGTRPFDWRLGTFLLWEYRDGPLWAW